MSQDRFQSEDEFAVFEGPNTTQPQQNLREGPLVSPQKIYSVDNLLSDSTAKKRVFPGKENNSECKPDLGNYINNCMAAAFYQQAMQCYRPFMNCQRPFVVNPFYQQPYLFTPMDFSRPNNISDQIGNTGPFPRQLSADPLDLKTLSLNNAFQARKKRRGSHFCNGTHIGDPSRIYTCASCDYNSTWKCDMYKHCRNYGHKFGYCPTPQKNGYTSDQLNAKLDREIRKCVSELRGKSETDESILYECEHCYFATNKAHYHTMHLKAHQN